MKRYSKKMAKALDAAFNTCFLVQQNSSEVLASHPDSESDLIWHRDATEFIEWYKLNRGTSHLTPLPNDATTD